MLRLSGSFNGNDIVRPVRRSPYEATTGTAASGIHVFSRWPDHGRMSLSGRADLWTGVIDTLTIVGEDLDRLLEFLPDDETRLASEAAQLRAWLGLP